MYINLTLVVSVVLLSTERSSNSVSFSWFSGGKRNYTVGYKTSMAHTGLGMACEGRYSTFGNETLSLGDFGLFSALTYESRDQMPDSLQHWFPKWYIAHMHEAGETRQPNDWTTFFEYSHTDNKTSVIAIRGTDTTLDVLNDINIWLTAALMQIFDMLGPSLSVPVAQGVSQWSNLIYGKEDTSKRYFQYMMDYVRTRVEQEGGRRTFYIVGHSLGGGIAKLIASRVEIQAVTFMAPGLGWTGYVVFQEAMQEKMMNLTLTVQPGNDIVSRIDHQVGTVVPAECNQDFGTCHKLWSGALCAMFEGCGSMRPPGYHPLEVPCGLCGYMPCE